MKICIIAMPRSRSSLLLETISNFYSIPILGQDINKLTVRYGDEYITNLKNLINLNSSKLEGVIRFHPLQMVTTKPFKVINLEWFNFEQYDKIYFVDRQSISDTISSLFIAEEFNKFTYTKKSDLLEIKEKLTFVDDERKIIRGHVFSSLIMEKVRNYLKNINKEFTDLYYESIDNYIKNSYPNTAVSHVETNYNYKELIINYDQIIEIYNSKKDIYKEVVLD